MAKILTDSLLISLLATISTALGCGVMSAVKASFPGLHMMRRELEVLCNALWWQQSYCFPTESLISAILDQLNAAISYQQSNCELSVRPEQELEFIIKQPYGR
ncbi:hypothetical protein KIN20_005925 [Parelaphostrongylus tenuis]|uniref:Uncharacterized protein n=1 Tax=Parelaphostrongylus tenuis TaxID=148309 RepID=A0AAD5M0W8_PARTN|nr:hypothetical protein KIN20_005925 [Parelaphostrongylus tenuis]